MRRARRPLRFLPPLAAAFVLVACAGGALASDQRAQHPVEPGRYSAPAPPRRGVLLLGDSNLAWSGPAVLHTFAGSTEVMIDAEPGILTTDPRWPARIAADRARREPEVVVVQLGTNDGDPRYPGRPAGFEGAIDAVMRELPRVPVLWTTIRAAIGSETAAHLNADLALARARWPNLHLVDLAEHFAGHAEWAQPRAIHWTDAGHEEYARWMLFQVLSLTRR